MRHRTLSWSLCKTAENTRLKSFPFPTQFQGKNMSCEFSRKKDTGAINTLCKTLGIVKDKTLLQRETLGHQLGSPHQRRVHQVYNSQSFLWNSSLARTNHSPHPLQPSHVQLRPDPFIPGSKSPLQSSKMFPQRSRHKSANDCVGMVKTFSLPTLSANPKPGLDAPPTASSHPVHHKVVVKMDPTRATSI